jgi:hypothetical protein
MQRGSAADARSNLPAGRARAEGEGQMTVSRVLVIAAFLAPLASAAQENGTSYTLYRTSPSDASMRIHVATFDAKETESYNRENCQVAAKLFAAQPSVTVHYFCEKGRYRE